MKVLLDSNILMMLEERRLDLSELRGRMAILEPCLKEIRMLAQFKGRRGRAARVALKAIEVYNIEVIPWEGDCDPAIEEAARKFGYAVATADKKLIKKLSGIELLRVWGRRLVEG